MSKMKFFLSVLAPPFVHRLQYATEDAARLDLQAIQDFLAGKLKARVFRLVAMDGTLVVRSSVLTGAHLVIHPEGTLHDHHT